MPATEVTGRLLNDDPVGRLSPRRRNALCRRQDKEGHLILSAKALPVRARPLPLVVVYRGQMQSEVTVVAT